MGAMRTTPPTGTLSPPASHPTPKKKKRVARKLRETSLEVWAWDEIGTLAYTYACRKQEQHKISKATQNLPHPKILRTAQHSAHSGSTQKTRQM